MNETFFLAAVVTPLMVLAAGLVVFLIGWYGDRPRRPGPAE